MGGAIISGERRGGVRREVDLSTCFSNGSYTRHRLFHGDVYSRDPGPCFDSLHVFRGATRNAGTIKRATTTVTVFGEGEKADKYTECMK